MAELLFQSKQEKLPDGSPIIITKILGAIDGTTVRQFEDKLIGFFNQGVKNLILIFSDVKYINSTGMGLLVKLADKFQEGGGDIKLVGVPEKVIALFDMLGLLSLFKIYETEEDAVESITQGGSGNADGAASKAAPKAPAPTPTPPPPPKPTVAAAPPPPPPVQKPATPQPPPHVQKPVAAPPPPPPVQKPATPQPPPHAQKPVAAPPPPPPDEMSGGIEIGGGIQIGSEGIIDEQPKAVSWPFDANCSHCAGAIQFAAKGNYKCPRCGSFIGINEYGQQTVFASVSSHMIEMRCPCDNLYTTAVKSTISCLAQQSGFTNVFCDEIGTALDSALAIVIEKSTNRMESYQILAVADAAEMIVGVKSLNPFLSKGDAPRDNRLPLIARKVDRLEVFPLPNKGQLLKMTKKKK